MGREVYVIAAYVVFLVVMISWLSYRFIRYEVLPEERLRRQRKAAAEAKADVALDVLAHVSFQRSTPRRQGGGDNGLAAAAAAEEEQCAVCLGKMEDGEMCCVLPACGHEFHRDCMAEWVQKAKKNTCPMCRVQVKKKPCVVERPELEQVLANSTVIDIDRIAS